MSKTVSVAHYLFTRLRQLGATSVHGVPGDYTLRSLDLLKPAGLRWIGNCNELNAGYAADGYARVKGISALFTTSGVGELSALNAVAGSYAEYAPVVHVVGTAARNAYRTRAIVHHSLGDGDLEVFARVYENFTVAQASLFDAATAPNLIDNTLQRCIEESRPVYIGLPSDMAGVEIDAEALPQELDVRPPTNPRTLEDSIVRSVVDRILCARQPYILVDGLAAADGIVEEINEIARLTGIPTFSLTFGGGIIDGTLPNYHGVHAGKFGSLDFTSYMDSADLCLLFSPLLSDTNTQGWSAVPRTDITVTFRREFVQLGETKPHSLHIKGVMKELVKRLRTQGFQSSDYKNASLPSLRKYAASLAPPGPSAPLDQDSFYLRISSFFRPHDIILCANGTPLVGGREFILPPKTKLLNSGIWLSVGSQLPATQGAALAQREIGTGGRTILFEGDGSFQATAQELSTIIKYKLDVIIFLINNDGYTFERLIHGLDAEYNDVAPWDYLKAPDLMGMPRDGPYTVEKHDVGTWGELQQVLDSATFQEGKGLKMVNVRMARDDVIKAFKPALELAGRQLMADATSAS